MEYKEEHANLWNPEQKRVNYNYRLNAFLFCRKWFALKCALERAEKRHEHFILCWLDADVLMYDYMDGIEENLMPFLDGEKQIAFLDRAYIHSECGLMFFKSGSISREVINRVCDIYRSHSVFNLTEWQDCFVFDTVRESFPAKYFSPLATGYYGEDVFSKCFFNEYAQHLKGCIKKDIKDIVENAKRRGQAERSTQSVG